MKYAMVFDVSYAGDNIILQPSHIISGIIMEGEMYDYYNNPYSLIRNYNELSDSTKRFVGFPISDFQLEKYFKYDDDDLSDSDTYAGMYQEFCEKFIYYINKKDKNSCVVVNMETKEIAKVKFNKSLIEQLNKNKFIQINQEDEEVQEEQEEQEEDIKNTGYTFIDTDKIYKNVIDKVIGQDEAASILVSTIARNLCYSSHKGMRSNILLYGPTGCGKTALLKAISSEFNVPFLIENMSGGYTANGYIGESVINILKKLYNRCNGNIELAEHAIVMLDEIDKLATTNPRETVNKTDVQEELLKITEGSVFNLGVDKSGKEIIIDTSHITFIMSGAFMGITDPVKKNNSIGFTSNNKKEDSTMPTIDNEAFVKYGLKPEFLGRESVWVQIKKLDVDDLANILIKSSISDLKLYENAFKDVNKVKIVYTNKYQFAKDIAAKAYEKNVGARGLKSVVDYVFMKACTQINKELPYDRELIVSSDIIEDNNKYVLRKVMKGSMSVDELPRRARQSN